MKLKNIVIAALAALSFSASADPAVTPRQMNAACAAVANSSSNYTDRVNNLTRLDIGEDIHNLSNMVAQGTAGGLSNYVAGVEQRMSAQYHKNWDYLNETSNRIDEVNAALTSTSNYVASVSPAGLSNYVATVEGNLSQAIIDAQNEDDGVYFDEGGMYFKVLEYQAGGIVTNRKYYVNLTATETIGSWEGAVVTWVDAASVNPVLTNGQVMALSYDDDYFGDNTLSFGPRVVMDVGGETVTNNYPYLCFSETVVTNIPALAYTNFSATGECWDCYGYNAVIWSATNVDFEGRQLEIIQTLQRYDEEGELTNTTVQARYRIEPRKLTQARWRSALCAMDDGYIDDDTPYSPTHPSGTTWHNAQWVQKDYALSVRATPKTTQTPTPTPVMLQSAAPVPRFTTAANDDHGQTINFQIYADAPHGAEKVDAYGYFGIDPEKYWCSPETVYRTQDWNDLSKWIPLPQSADLPKQDPISGEWGKQRRNFKNIDTIKKLMEQLGDTHLPPAYPEVTWGEYKKCSSVGHIWKKCECEACEVRRDHTWGLYQSTLCDRCLNYDSLKEKDSRCKYGYKPAGNGERCLTKCDEVDETHHRVWHHSGADYAEVSCLCECGLYTEGHRHLYEESAKESISEWTDAGDGHNHWGLFTCTREGCGHNMQYFQPHTLETDPAYASDSAIYIDNSNHKVHGRCAKHAQGCAYVGYIQEGHSRDNTCWCWKCKEYCHQYNGAGKRCGNTVSPNTCIHCGEIQNSGGTTYTFIHDFNPASQNDTEQHTCACGEKYHDHEFENGVCKGGHPHTGSDSYPDSGCGMKKNWKGHKCPFKKKSNGGASTDEDHEDNDRSDTAINGQCTDCGGKVKNGDFTPSSTRIPVHPDPTDPTKCDPQYPEEWHPLIRWCYTLTGSNPARGIGSHANFDSGLSTIDTMLSVAKGYLSDGDSWSVTIWHSPSRTTISTRAGSQEILNWKQETYSCTKATDSDGNSYYDWK